MFWKKKDYTESTGDHENILQIIEKDENYIVYINKNNKVRVQLFNGQYTPLITNTIAEIEFMQRKPTVRYMPNSLQIDFACMLGEIAVLAILGNGSKVNEFFPKVEDYLLRRNGEISRRWQLQICLFFLPILLILPFISHFSNYIFRITFAAGQSDFLFLMSGGLGSMLSIFLKRETKYYDCEAGLLLNIFEVATRIITGMIFSFILLALIDMGLILPMFDDVEMLSSMIVVSIIAGFSERLVPSFIYKLENNNDNNIDEKN